MAYDPGTIEAALCAAVGNDAPLIADLRLAFVESAERQIDLLSRARCDANWQMAAWRLKGLCATFGVHTLLTIAEDAANAAPGDPSVIRRLRRAMVNLQNEAG
jgi:HPt (histidine-containing phosphotransfer) domain-containing protein